MGFLGLIVVAGIGTALFAVGWGAKAHGYEIPNSKFQIPKKMTNDE